MKRIAAFALAAVLLLTGALLLSGCKKEPVTPTPLPTRKLNSISASYLFIQKGNDTFNANTNDETYITRILNAYNGAEYSVSATALTMDAASTYHVIFITEDGQISFDMDKNGTCRLNKSETLFVLTERAAVYNAIDAVYTGLYSSQTAPSGT